MQIGREMVVAEKSGPWLRVYANTDIEEEHTSDQPIFGAAETPPPVSGWIEAKGIVIENTPNGDQILMGAAADQEAEASDPRGPVNAARSGASALSPHRRDVSQLAAGAGGRLARRRHSVADSEG